MKRFKDFAEERSFEGDKISINDILNQEIVVLNYRISPSKRKEGTQYTILQIEHEGVKRVVFTGSTVLSSQVQKYQSELPFLSIIRKINDFYTFT